MSEQIQVAGLPANELDRLQALAHYRILDTPEEGEFDLCARLIAQICGTEMSGVTLIDQDRQWFKAVYGDLPRAIPRHGSFCSYTLLHEGVMEVPDTLLDPRFAQHPQVRSAPFIRFYAGIALQARSGLSLGTICVMGRHPMHLLPPQLQALDIAASYIAAQLEVRLGIFELRDERTLGQAQCDAITRATQRQKDLSALLVHDLRSPLASITANSRFVAQGSTLTADQRAALDDIIIAGERLSGMVTDLLDVSRAEEGHQLIRHTQPLALMEIAERAISLSRASAAEREVEVTFEGSSINGTLLGDPELLFRVLTNLLDNAYRYAPSGSTVRVELTAPDDSFVLRVIDDGPGIPPEQRERVFDKYFQVEQQVPSRPTFGLGLSFCKLAIEAHAGSIEVEDVGPGCCFRIALPRLGSAASATIPPGSTEAQAESVVQLARQLADEVLNSARGKEDQKLERDEASAATLRAVKQERREADTVLDDERADADRQLQDERDKR